MLLFSTKKTSLVKVHSKSSIVERFFVSKMFNVASTFFLVLFYCFFLYRHVLAYAQGASFSIFLYIFMESTVIVLFIFRRKAIVRTAEFKPILYALAGTFTPLLFNPIGGVTLFYYLGISLLISGCIFSILSYFSLNRSMGISPAMRVIKTTGLYNYIRHPMYASYFFIHVGYLILWFNVWNLVLVVFTVYFQINRSFFEEALLMQSEQYRAYKEKVPWRFIPKVF